MLLPFFSSTVSFVVRGARIGSRPRRRRACTPSSPAALRLASRPRLLFLSLERALRVFAKVRYHVGSGPTQRLNRRRAADLPCVESHVRRAPRDKVVELAAAEVFLQRLGHAGVDGDHADSRAVVCFGTTRIRLQPPASLNPSGGVFICCGHGCSSFFVKASSNGVAST